MKKVQIIVEYVTSDPGSAESVASQMVRTVELADWSAAHIYADVQDIEEVGSGNELQDLEED